MGAFSDDDLVVELLTCDVVVEDGVLRRVEDHATSRLPEVTESFAYLAVKPAGSSGHPSLVQAGRVAGGKGCPSESVDGFEEFLLGAQEVRDVAVFFKFLFEG